MSALIEHRRWAELQPDENAEPVAVTRHGRCSPDHTPMCTVEHGDTVVFGSLDAGWSVSGHETQPPMTKTLPRGDDL